MKEFEYEIPLLQALIKLGGTARTKDALVVVESILSKKINPDSAEYGYNKVQKEIVWKNKTRWARQRLKEKGQIDGAIIGIWAITDSGRKRVEYFLANGVDTDLNTKEKKEIVNPLTTKSVVFTKREIGKKSEVTLQIEAVIREMVLEDKNVINSEIVDRVKNKLNILVDKKKISRIRNQIGLGSYDLYNNTMRKIEESTFEKLALLMALQCVRNTVIEDYHSEGKIDDSEMMAFNKEVVNKIYTFLRFYFGSMPTEETSKFMAMNSMFLPNWDKPTLDKDMMAGVAIAMGKSSE
jgi:hypothetical protein